MSTWIECPHGCGAKRQNTEMMQEHVDSQHADVRTVPKGPITAPGEAIAPNAILQEIEQMQDSLVETTHLNKDMVMRQQRDSGLKMDDGKILPEFVTAWRPDGMRVKVHARRVLELLMKGFKFKPPTNAELQKTWFHWRCPIRSCPSHNNVCEIHGLPGDDSNHHLQSEDYIIIDHLHSGGKVHRQFFEMHKEELASRYKDAWMAWEAADQESAAITERARQEHERELAGAAAAGGGNVSAN